MGDSDRRHNWRRGSDIGRGGRLARVCMILACLLAGPVAGVVPDARAVVRNTTERVLEILRNERDAINEEPSRVFAVIDEEIVQHVDFDLMARWALGKHWRDASPSQRRDFTREFKRLVIRTYATALLEYTNESVEYGPVHADSDGQDVLVPTSIKRPGGPPIAVGYRLRRNTAGEWKVYDLVIDGVSLLTTYRSSFASELRGSRLDQLIHRLVEHNKDVPNK